MSDLFWPGDQRAGQLMSDEAFLATMVVVETAWLAALVEAGVAPPEARIDLTTLVSPADTEAIAAAAEADGNPVIGLVALLRDRADGEAARWLHRGLTSQDVVDTALALCLSDVVSRIRTDIVAQVRSLIGLTETHRRAPMLARTLTQPALPSTVAAKLANWLSGVLDAADTLTALPVLPVQAGGAAGTLAATTELTGSPKAALALTEAFAAALGLIAAAPWHTARSLFTRAGDALVTCCAAWGHIANDVATGSRAEIGELAEGRGGRSSAMPHKNNPVLSVLIRRAALVAPQLAATLHAAAAASVDERADGGWHAEWATLRTLTRRSVVASSHTAELLAGLKVDTQRCAANLAAASELRDEQLAMTELTGRPPLSDYTGAAEHFVDAALQRARHYFKEAS